MTPLGILTLGLQVYVVVGPIQSKRSQSPPKNWLSLNCVSGNKKCEIETVLRSSPHHSCHMNISVFRHELQRDGDGLVCQGPGENFPGV